MRGLYLMYTNMSQDILDSLLLYYMHNIDLIEWCEIELDVNLVAPSRPQLQLLPCSFNINLKHMLVSLAHSDRIHWYNLIKNGDKHILLE